MSNFYQAPFYFVNLKQFIVFPQINLVLIFILEIVKVLTKIFYVKETRNFRRFLKLHYISPNNSKNTNYKPISLAGTDHCNSKLSRNIQFEKYLFFLRSYFRRIARFL